MSTTTQTAAKDITIAELEALLAAKKGKAPKRTFEPQTFMGRGGLSCGVKVQGGPWSLNGEQALTILRDLAGFKAAVKEAFEKLDKPGEEERVLREKAERESKKTGKGAASHVSVSPAVSADERRKLELQELLAALPG
jgi:hypothetical protein